MNPGLPDEETFLVRKGTTSIGRTKDNAIFCLHKSLSRRHAQLDYDGERLKVTDLQSKNGIFFDGKRVERCELAVGDTFRCGDIRFRLEGPSVHRIRAVDRSMQTLQSPAAFDPSADGRPGRGVAIAPVTVDEEDHQYKDKLFVLVRATELCVGSAPIGKLLDDIAALAIEAIEADRIAILTVDDRTRELRPRVIASNVPGNRAPYSDRVVGWVVAHSAPALFDDLSLDRTLGGEPDADIEIHSTMAVPLSHGGKVIGVLYADSLTQWDQFRPAHLSLFQGLANLAVLAIENATLKLSTHETLVSRR